MAPIARFDLQDATAISRAVREREQRKTRLQLFVAVVGYVSGVFGMAGLYFARSGQLKFEIARPADWIVVLFITMLVVLGVLGTRKQYTAKSSFEVNRTELGKLAAIARYEAVNSVVNLSGDITWLEDDLPALNEVMQKKPSLMMQVYYDKGRVHAGTEAIRHRAEAVGIEFIPYPAGSTVSIRCMITDHTSDDSRRVFTFTRLENVGSDVRRAEHRFMWREFGSESPIVGESVTSLIQMLHSVANRSIRIGISGVNNVGKTTIAGSVHKEISSQLSATLVLDVFRGEGSGISMERNYAMLWDQFQKELTPGSGAVTIYDRTTIDNLCYLRARNHEDLYQALAPRIAEHARRFDLIFDIRRPDNDYSNSTTHVSGDMRKQAREFIDTFLLNYQIKVHVVVVDVNQPESMAEAINTICKRILEVTRNWRVDPRSRKNP